MNLVLGSCFRHNSEESIRAYAERVRALSHLATARGDSLSLISVWGDCDDDTPEKLGRVLPPLRLDWTLIDRTHGLGVFGSTEHPARLKGFAYAVNGVLQAVQDDAQVFIYVESDLLWEAETIYQLVDQLSIRVDILAPPTFTTPDCFYDTFAFRTLDGVRFGPFAPYSEAIKPGELTPLSSAGGCLVMHAQVARDYRCTPEESLVGFCKEAVLGGNKIFTDWSTRVWHP